jgi:hypothetical protein
MKRSVSKDPDSVDQKFWSRQYSIKGRIIASYESTSVSETQSPPKSSIVPENSISRIIRPPYEEHPMSEMKEAYTTILYDEEESKYASKFLESRTKRRLVNERPGLVFLQLLQN